MTCADKIQIIIGILSLFATVAVSVVIYIMQRRYEKEQRRREISEQAQRFMMDNNSELVYLPWCVIAVNQSLLDNHSRKIYTEFCRLPTEVRDEVLKLADIRISVDYFSGKEWINECLDCLKRDIKEYKLGTDILYDDGKYFFRNKKYYLNNFDIFNYRLFDPIYPVWSFESVLNKSGKKTLDEYVADYFRFVTGDKTSILKNNVQPPIDYVWRTLGADSVFEDIACGWVMALVDSIAINIQAVRCKSTLDYDDKLNIITDAKVETYEDMYYKTLIDLYCTYKLM